MEKENQNGKKEHAFVSFVVNEAEYKTLTNKMYETRKPYEPKNPNLLRAFMPGNIPEMSKKKGDLVKEGDKLLILEAMKMKNLILAPFDGKIKSVNVKVGDKVSKNHVLVEVTPQKVKK